MKIYEAGRETKLLGDIKKGTKTVEVRLNRGKFANYQPDDQVWLREDIYKDGQIVDSKPKQVLVEVKKVEHYPDFETLMKTVGYQNVVPQAKNLVEAIATPRQFYSAKDEKKYGALAIYFKVLSDNPAT